MPLALRPSRRALSTPGPVLLVVMDGVGLAPAGEGNAVARAHTPNIDWLTANAAFRGLRAHGRAVGLPSDEDMGNSEVGHNAMGAGRIYAQGALLVNQAVASGAIFTAPCWRSIVERLRATGGTLHLIGLLSDGNVHSHEQHLHALLRQAAREELPSVAVHALLDGRDVPSTSALVYVDRLEAVLAEIRDAAPPGQLDYRVASGGGRMTTTMDRYEADWRIVERGWQAQVHGVGRGFASLRAAIETVRNEQAGIQDQNLPAFVIERGGSPAGRMADGDAVVFFNFRGDRSLEVTRAFEAGDDFDRFDRGSRPDLLFAGMMQYDAEAGIPRHYLVQPPALERTVSEYLAGSGVTQLAISETQKFGHVTYFWNGNRAGCFDARLETYVEIPSDRLSFDERPWMKSAEIAERAITAIASGEARFVRLNFPGGDMVGHTGNIDAAIVAMSAIDLCIGRLIDALRGAQGTLVLTADHGNAEDMFERDKEGRVQLDKAGKPRVKTSHSLNPVGLWIHRPAGGRVGLRADLPEAGLANLASTLCELLGFEPPEDYLPSLLAADDGGAHG